MVDGTPSQQLSLCYNKLKRFLITANGNTMLCSTRLGYYYWLLPCWGAYDVILNGVQDGYHFGLYYTQNHNLSNVCGNGTFLMLDM